ncbi:MAG: hypothetical protein CSA33_05475 [Desulfobulbus propionicus]|nr:MAG: hypothetical protein CSA33_05475 [Desulfobulbus propionicus]
MDLLTGAVTCFFSLPGTCNRLQIDQIWLRAMNCYSPSMRLITIARNRVTWERYSLEKNFASGMA